MLMNQKNEIDVFEEMRLSALSKFVDFGEVIVVWLHEGERHAMFCHLQIARDKTIELEKRDMNGKAVRTIYIPSRNILGIYDSEGNHRGGSETLYLGPSNPSTVSSPGAIWE